jgi:hypothetical protein
VLLPGGRPATSTWIVPADAWPDGVTVVGVAPCTVSRVTVDGSSASPQRVARNVASMPAVPSAAAVTFWTCVAGVPQSGTSTQVTSWPAWKAVVATVASVTQTPSTSMTYSNGPAGRSSNRVASHPPSTVVIACPALAHPFQLPTTRTSDDALAGWYQTVTEHERCGTSDDDDDPWHAAASTTSRHGVASADRSRTPPDVALRHVGAAPAAQSA